MANTYDLTGNNVKVNQLTIGANQSDTAISSAPQIQAGSGAPTHSANQGTLYIRTDGSSTATRLYVNTNGSTTWTNFTSAA